MFTVLEAQANQNVSDDNWQTCGSFCIHVSFTLTCGKFLPILGFDRFCDFLNCFDVQQRFDACH